MSVRAYILTTVRRFAQNRFDWDGASALPIRPDVYSFIAKERGMLDNQSNDGVDPELLDDCGEPDITLNQDGTVELCFEKFNRELIITVRCGGVITFIRSFEDSQTSFEGTIRSPYHDTKSKQQFGVETNALLYWLHCGISGS